MRRGIYIPDAQQALGFMVEQASHIEAEVVRISYPDIQYPTLVPIDTSANEWAKSITFFSMDKAGQAAWFNAMSTDMQLADVARTKHEEGVHMAGIGYRYNLEELGQAMMIPGTNLTPEKAEAARRAYEEFMDQFALYGDTAKGAYGLTNNPNVTIVNVADDGTQNSQVDSPAWKDKTNAQIIRDVNDVLTGVYTASLTVELADTLLLPIAEMNRLATLQMENTTMTVLDWIKQHNTYTAQTGQPLMIRGIRGLETAGEGGVGRAIAYRRDPRVVKMHVPMPHRFLPVWQTGPIQFDVPGIFRTAGVEVRRPGAMRYVDHVSDAAYE